MSANDAVEEILPGHKRADLLFIAQCLEGQLGEGRKAEAAPQAAAFIRAALARPPQPRARLLVPRENLPAVAESELVALTRPEYDRLMEERRRAERNQGDGDDHGPLGG